MRTLKARGRARVSPLKAAVARLRPSVAAQRVAMAAVAAVGLFATAALGESGATKSWSVGNVSLSLLPKDEGQIGEGPLRFHLVSPAIPGGRVLAIDALTDQVENVVGYGSDRIAIIGRSSASHTVNIVDARSATVVDTLYCYRPSVSPTGRFIAFEEFYQRSAPVQSTVYGVYDLAMTGSSTGRNAASAGASRSARVYPRSGERKASGDDETAPATHWAQSSLHWVSDFTVAFLDYSSGVTRLVAVNLSRGLEDRVVFEKRLDPGLLVSESGLEPGVEPGRLIRAIGIRRLEGEGLRLRLKLPEDPALKARWVDVTLSGSSRGESLPPK